LTVEIRVLGRVDALVDGRSLPLRGSKQRGVLAMLALRANRTVSVDVLIDGLWGDRPTASAAKNVQHYIWRLRKALDANGSGAQIVTRGRGYELQLPEEAVDAARFERLVERARREAEQGIADGAVKGALELWRGAPLADVAEEPFAGPEIRRLEELHLRALELTIDAELAAGRHGEVIGNLEAQLAEHPLNERFHAQRMLALYRAGRQSEALEAYRQARQTLSEEIGVEPGPELRLLQEQILRQDPALAAPAPPEELPPQLEGGSPLLAGRKRELGWLRGRWQQARSGRSRVALVSGPSGIGKTRLVAELATEVHRGGVTVLYAAGSGPPEAALDAIRGAGESERPTLLVLDDADDVPPPTLEAAAALAAQTREPPLLIVVLHRDVQGPPEFARLVRAATSHRLALDPLPADASAEIAALYAPADGVAMPAAMLMAESEGVPLRVHRAASAWAQGQASARLEAKVGGTAGERGLGAAQAELAGSVAELQVARERTHLYLVSEPIDPSASEVCPFRGLAPFDAAQSEYFFGRERLVAGLVARLVGSTRLAVFGPSGSGKSSVLRAGLLPALADGVLPGSERWRQVPMRPGAHPLAELDRALARNGADQGDGQGPLAAALGSLAPEERLVLAVDQFEELFTACRDEGERTAFVEALVSAADDPDQRALVVLAIRADFYGHCADYRTLSAQISANQVLVGPMTREELRRAIELPAHRAGLRVELALVSELVDDVADQPGGLPLLQTALLELWEQRSGRTLRAASYEASGGVNGAVARLAERAYGRLSEPQRERARGILLRLADAEQPTPVRRRVPLSELEVERDEVAAGALAVLTDSRLVTVDEGTVEVAHEALLREWPRLRRWLEEDAEGRRLHQHLIGAAGEWQASGRDPAELYRGARLASALDWASGHGRELNELEREFLDESRATSEREAERQRRANRRLRTLLAGVGVLLALAVVAGVIALSERQDARTAARAEAAQRLGAQAGTEDRLDQALRLATAGVALDDSVATRSSLLSVLQRSPAALGVLNGDGDPLTALALSPDGRTLAFADHEGTVSVFDTETRKRIGEHQAPGTVWALAFDPRGDSLAIPTSSSDGLAKLQIVDPSTLRVRSSVSLGPYPADPSLGYYATAVYAPDGRSLVVSYSTGDIDYSAPVFLRRFDARSGSPIGPAVRVAPRSSKIPLRLNADGRLLVSTATNKATYAIDVDTLRVVRRYPVRALGTAISPDGRTLAFEPGAGGLRMLDLASGRVRTVAGRDIGDLGVGAFSPDGRTLSTWVENKGVILWDVERGVETETFEGHGGGAYVFSPDGRTLYTAGGDSASILDVEGDHRLIRPFRTNTKTYGDRSELPAFAISPDGGTLAVARRDGRVDLIDAQTLRRIGGFEAFAGKPALAIEYSPDGRRLAVAGVGGAVGLWDVGSGRRVGSLLGTPRGSATLENPRNVQALAFDNVGLLAAASTGGPKANITTPGAVRIWDLDAGELIRRPLRLPHGVLGLAFSPDGSQLAIAFGADNQEGRDGVEVRDVPSGERLARLRSDDEVGPVAFSPDGRLLAAGQIDGNVVVWAAGGWGRVGQPLALGRGMTLGLAFSPDGRTLASSHDDATVVLWDVASQQPIGSPLPVPYASDFMVTARFTPDGDQLFAVSDAGRAIRWGVDPEAWVQHACAVAGGLTPEQWAEVVPEQDYISACPSG
jgi:DNA-binding SARP family transcriptional activator/WD40 repeat protein